MHTSLVSIQLDCFFFPVPFCLGLAVMVTRPRKRSGKGQKIIVIALIENCTVSNVTRFICDILSLISFCARLEGKKAFLKNIYNFASFCVITLKIFQEKKKKSFRFLTESGKHFDYSLQINFLQTVQCFLLKLELEPTFVFFFVRKQLPKINRAYTAPKPHGIILKL